MSDAGDLDRESGGWGEASLSDLKAAVADAQDLMTTAAIAEEFAKRKSRASIALAKRASFVGLPTLTPTGARRAFALYDYAAVDEGELSFAEGEIVRSTRSTTEGVISDALFACGLATTRVRRVAPIYAFPPPLPVSMAIFNTVELARRCCGSNKAHHPCGRCGLVGGGFLGPPG